MNTLEFLSRLRKLGVKLLVEDQKLRLNVPQGVLTTSLKTELKDRKIELLNFLREQRQTGVAVPPPIRPTERSPDLRLSFAQQRLWFLTQMELEHPVYNVPMAFRLSGLVSIVALRQSFADMIARHEILRTTFSTLDGQPVQIIHESDDQPLSIKDFQHLPEDKREIEVENAINQEITKPFDLENGPLFRTKLLRLAASEHILLILTHHIVFDGWSYEILCHELTTLYASKVAGQSQHLPKLPIQYADFAAWQRVWLRGPFSETQFDYWREQLADAPTVLQLPTDRPYPAVQRFQGRSYNFALPLELSRALHTFSQQEGSTLFMTGLASFMLLLYRYTRQEDLIVGTPIANRSYVELEGLIGPLINTLALRAIISEGLSFRELLSQVRRTALAAYDHQDLPFEKLVEALQLERDISHTPLFQVTFVLHQETSNLLTLTGLEVSEIELETYTAKFDLTLNLIEGETGIRGQLEYNTDLFDEASIARLMGHYETLLESIVANPDQRISDVQILTDPERKQMLIDWNDTSSGYPCDRCVHQLFEAQTEQAPESVAVVFGDDQLTYQELNCRANQLAHYLLGQGIGPDVLVGIFVQRSLEMVVGLLGILKAGGAYVPLDPAYPAERLAFMLSDTQIPVLCTQKRLVDKLPVYAGEILCLDGDESTIARENEGNPASGATPANLAYVIYTSGSTGLPKGVEIQHTGVVNLIAWHQQTYKVVSADRVTQLASLAFDASVWELWPYLTAGASIHIPNEETRVSPPKLLEWLSTEAITLSFMPTPLAESVLEEQSPKSLALRALLTGGDKLHRRPSKDLPFRLVNHYGPTENTVVTTWAPVDPVSEADAPPPIGRPIANTQVYILDAQLQPVPIGVPGELYTGGDGLARSYLNRPELTAEKFIPDPFSRDPAARLYKTGDLARYLPDGNIEFSGRIDHQVKIRGFRIELGEVESVLDRHPAVEEAVVIARGDVPGDKRLVAYVVASHESTPTFSELRRYLKEKLPDYMIPTALMFLDLLPLTPNGKVDRRALPAPDVVRPDMQEAFVAPRSQSEELVAGIWSNVLGLERIGVYDSFFELGGHSLLVVQIISRIREVFEVELPLRALFEAPTVAGLTERIETARRSDEGIHTFPLQAVSRDQDLPLSFAQQRLWFLHHLEPDSVAYSIPRSIRLKGVLNKNALQKTYVELARRHETLRTAFHSIDGHPVLCIAAEPNIVFDTLDLRHLPDAERETEAKRLSAEDARKPFDLRRGPLFRIRLFQLEDQEHVLHFNMHHIISDGWSFGVMAREIAALYPAFIKGKPADLPELPVQYADYAVWQRQWLQGEALKAQLTYWKDKLGGELPVLELPTDRPRPAVQTHRGAIESFALTKELTEALQAMSRREGVTLFMTLLAAFKTLLYRITGQEDTIVGTPIAGRNRTELEGLIGFFMNTIVMRTDLSGNPTFRELLGRVRETALGAYAHQDMPFERLVEELSPERDLSRTPLFQVFFNHIVAMGDKATELPGLEAEAVGGGLDRESKFDMTLYVLEGEEGLVGGFEYNTDLFDAERIERMVGHFQTLLEGIVADPGKCICDLSILDEAQRRQLLVAWNDTVVEYPREKCIHKLFEKQAERTPDAAAVIFGKQQLTYRELNTRANKLAHYLQSQGVVAESRVGIWMDRSLDMMVALLGTLKAGGAYVPLDPNYPQERLAFMLEDAQAQVLLTREKFLEDLAAYAGHVVCLDKDFEAIADGSEENPISDITPDSAAYVIYTSGSTGTPKGVIGLHRGAVNRLSWMWRVYPFKDGEVCCQKTYLSFVDSVWEIFGPLLKGVPAVIIPEEVVKDPPLLVENLAAAKVSRILLVPSLLGVLLDSFDDLQKRLFDLKIWVSSGEEISVELAQRFGQVMPEAKLINLYGSSEVSADVSCYEVADGKLDRCIPIGRPIDNTSIYILDSHQQPVPIGVPGELYIGGVGLARGYLNQPDLTAERFIPSPFGQEEVLFKTGDLGRYLADGNIEYLGRRDHQVKVRGFRIELGEIEARIKEVEAVNNCVVVLREDRPADTRLVAYYVFRDEQAVEVSDIRRHLQAKLPDYMVPQHFMELAAIPLTPNGKVDRKALLKPEADDSLEQSYVAPRSETEKGVADIWQEVLNRERVGVNDDFFNLGGHSLLATQVMSRLNKLFNIQLPLRRLFEAKTVGVLAEVIDISLWNAQGLQKSGITGIEEREVIEL